MTWSGGTIRDAEHVLVRLTDSDGAVGIAEAVPRPMLYGETTESVLCVYRDLIGPLVTDSPVSARETLLARLDSLVANHTAKGALDLAMADLACRRLGISCPRLLGGWAPSQEVTQVMTAGSPDEVAAQCVAMRERYGIRSFKLKVGHHLVDDVESVRRVRAEQPDCRIYVDANVAFDALGSLELTRRLDGLDLEFVEEPTPAGQVIGRARVAARVSLLGDESCTTPGEVAREVIGGRSHVVSIKIARTGYLASDRIRQFCETVGAPVVIGSQGDSGIGTLAALAYGCANRSTASRPGEYGWFLKLEDDLLLEPPEVVGGRLSVPGGPGNGVAIDERKLARYRTDGGS
jgi:L-Ala-D/L-Glu epimerase